MRTLRLWSSAAAILAVFGAARAADDPFRAQVAPIFEHHCLRCHQGERPKGGLSLVTEESFRRGGDGGAVVAPGKPEESLLFDMISGDKPEMPKEGEPLTKEQISAIRSWIENGVKWPAGLALRDKRFEGQSWWSLEPIARPAVPAVDSPWVRSDIDRFILDRLNREGLSPSPEAGRRTLIRRLSYDLHGLPPTPEEIAAFDADGSPDAYERLVDRLLASPRYGERWARHWLDVVHYGDSHGYDKDKPRQNSWPYRDYVIRALNAEKPYGRFIEEQLAGDVLFPDDPGGVVATGFIAAGPWDFVGHVELREGTVDKNITRLLDRDDMVTTAMSTFTSLTVHCARCHDHKFDPIGQEDYYRLQAVFAGVERADRPYDADPAVHRRRRELIAQREKLAGRDAEIVAQARKAGGEELARLDGAIEKSERELAALPADVKASSSNGYHSAIMPTADEAKWVQVDLGKGVAVDEVRLIPARPTDFRDAPGFGFPVRYKVEVSDDPQFATAVVLVDRTQEDVENPGDVPVAFDGKKQKARHVRVTATRLWKRLDDYVFALAEMQVLSAGKNVAAGADVSSLDSIEAGRWSQKYVVDGFSSRAALDGGNSAEKRAALASSLAERKEAREKLYASVLDAPVRKEWHDLRASLERVERELESLPPPQFVYAAANRFAPQGSFTPPPDGTREVHLLHRGDVKNPGEKMPPGAIACVKGVADPFQDLDLRNEGLRRAALARWITDPQNPLTARSIVNRVWHYHFGRGIVDTPSDFGRMGSRPTHPELLDYLADEFLEGGQSLKRLHRRIVTSAVYRQSSAPRPDGESIDSDNRFLWRMNRTRLDAESLRDAALFVAGRLDETMGGPSVQQFAFKDDHSPVYDYTSFDFDGPAGGRRSIYRFIVRSAPDPLMESFDCPDPSVWTPKRTTTVTALQALSLLNNPLFVKQAEHLAARVASERSTLSDQLRRAHELALGRPPTDEELQVLSAYASRHGLANACRVILNTNEFVFVD
ncbi:MAG: DUF1553 domain-containing protein [Planctomycetia bacterium]|nr:DUF1553 domain-containing protein [Planctomycetia bacterium]